MVDNNSAAIAANNHEIINTRELLRDAMRVNNIKTKGVKYLPKPTGMSDTLYNGTYKFNADFPSVLPEAINSMLGMVYRKKPVIEMGGLVEANLFNRGIVDYSRKILKETLLTGCGVLIDYQDASANFIYYDESAVDEMVVVSEEVVYLKLVETKLQRKGRGEWDSATEHLHYEKREDGVYSWRTSEDDSETEEILIKALGGNPIDEIPFVFFSATELNNKDDELPLEELVIAARKWYFIDAEHMIMLYMQKPTPYIVNVDKSPESIGSGTVWLLTGDDVQVGMLAAPSQGLSKHSEAKAEAAARMQAAAAKVIDVNYQESGASRGKRQSDQRATLAVTVETVSNGMTKLLKFASDFEGKTKEVNFDLSKEFEATTLDAQMLAKVIDSAVAQIVPYSVVYESLRTAGVTDLDDEQIKQLLDQQNQEAFTDENDE